MRRVKFPLSLNHFQLQLGVLIVFVILGSIYANVFIKEDVGQYKIVFDTLIEHLNSSEITKLNLFEFVLVNRLKVFVVLWLVGFIIYAKQINILFTAYFGASIGVLCSTAILVKGLSGYLFILILYIPQYLVYIPLYCYIIYSNTRFSDFIYNGRKTTKKLRINGQVIFQYFLVLIIILLTSIIGVFLESFVNLEIIRWYSSLG